MRLKYLDNQVYFGESGPQYILPTKKGSRAKNFINKPILIKKTNAFLTLGPFGCCLLMEIGPEQLQVEGQGPTCCKVTQSMGRTAECGTGWRSQRPHLLWQSCLSERWRWRSDFPFAARGSDQHRGRMGLKECKDTTDSWGLLGTAGSPLWVWVIRFERGE